ncbi:MAG: endonuclease/exonuclease/phosphatase family protein [Verrucomicrobia bacterium]|nr:endonuclease/exonuclease/phosphatase family protein [Verrucomicrobiota bacterium]
MIYFLENFLRKLRRGLSVSEWAIRHFKLPIPEDARPEKPGLLLIQIDGLARGQFEKALRRGKMPFLKRLLRRQHYELKSFYSGVPSTTPAVQGELFYGVPCVVPSFSFLNRAERRLATMYHPESVKPVEEILQQKGEGLLTGGSSWSNIYCGGATQEESHVCAASIGFGDMMRSKSFFSFIALMLLQIPMVLRTIGLVLFELVLAVWDVIEGVFRHRKQLHRELKFVFNRMFITIGLREVITMGAKIDLARGLPITHLNFLGYDEQAHRRGPGSAFAHWSLRGIDRAIERLFFAAQRSHRRDYQVWIFSDHGQEAVTPFSEIFEGGIEEAVRQGWEHTVKGQKRRKSRVSDRDSRAYWAGGKVARKRLAERSLWEQLTEDENHSFSIAAMGPVGHVYFAQELGIEEKRQFANWLVANAKIPGVLFKTEPGHALWIRRQGELLLPEEAIEVLPHSEKLNEEAARDLVCLCHNEYAGDVILLGWNTDSPPMTFEEERGAHGGPGPNETQGFLLVPENTRFPHTHTSYVRPANLREAALHLLRRKRISRVHRTAPHLRVMTYNVHACLGMDGKISTHRIAQVIERHDPAVIALQELDIHRSRSRTEHQVEMIAHELGMHFHFSPAKAHGEEQYGDAILSKYPLKLIRAENITKAPKVDPEPRGALWVQFEMDGILINLINTHFGLGVRERMSQAMDLLSKKWIGGIELNEPVILCGDFNTFPDTLPYRAFTSRLHDVQLMIPNFRARKTFSTASPVFRIDHIFVSGHFNVHKVQVPRNHLTRIASDHLPLVADLTFDERHLKTVPHLFPEHTAHRTSAESLKR